MPFDIAACSLLSWFEWNLLRRRSADFKPPQARGEQDNRFRGRARRKAATQHIRLFAELAGGSRWLNLVRFNLSTASIRTWARESSSGAGKLLWPREPLPRSSPLVTKKFAPQLQIDAFCETLCEWLSCRDGDEAILCGQRPASVPLVVFRSLESSARGTVLPTSNHSGPPPNLN